MHDDGVRITGASSGHDLDPAVERVVTRCLAREPSASARLGDRGVGGAARRRSAGRRARRRRDAVAGDGRRRRPHRGRVAGDRAPAARLRGRLLRRARRLAAGDLLPPAHAGGSPSGGARGSCPPGARSLRLPRAAGGYREPAARRPRLPGLGPSPARLRSLGPARDGTRAGRRALVSHQPKVPRAVRGLDERLDRPIRRCDWSA